MARSYPAPRVAQLDGHILDTELTSLLKEQLLSIFRLHATNRFSYSHHTELYDLLLKLVVFQLTVGKKSTSYGLLLQNLRLSNTSNGEKIKFGKKSALFLLIIGEYGYKRLQSYLYSIDDDQIDNNTNNPVKILKNILIKHRTRLLVYLDNTLKVLNLVNFILFLIDGRHANLIYRVLNISLTPIVPDLLKFNANKVNYEFQNRQLVWNVMTEFLVFTLPLLQLNKLRSFTRKLIPKSKSHKSESNSPYANLPLSQCAICHDNNKRALAMGQKVFESSGAITNPFITNCGHIYCYVCLASKFNFMDVSGESVKCLRCFKKLTWFEEYGANHGNDVVDPDAILFKNDDDTYIKADDNTNDDEDNDYNGNDNLNYTKEEEDLTSDAESDDIDEAMEEEEDEYFEEEYFDEDDGDDFYEESAMDL